MRDVPKKKMNDEDGTNGMDMRPGWMTAGQRGNGSLTVARYRGCLLGGAVGDALGAAVEFETLESIRRRLGPHGIRDYESFYGRAGAITDDTQLALFTAEGLLRARVRGASTEDAALPAMLAAAYQRWLYTQGAPEAVGVAGVPLDGWLLGHGALRARCAPDFTCVQALTRLPADGLIACNDSKNFGAVTRVAPIGMYVASVSEPGDPGLMRRAFELGIASAAITHGHPTARLAAGTLAAIVARLLQGAGLIQAVAASRAELVRHEGHHEVLRAVDLALELAREDPAGADTLARLGHGWTADEALAVGLYCAVAAESLEEGIVLAVNHSGNSDSTGAITGQLLGAMHGAHAIPGRWLDGLELRDVIREVADDLAGVAHWPLDEGDLEAAAYWRRKYPGR